MYVIYIRTRVRSRAQEKNVKDFFKCLQVLGLHASEAMSMDDGCRAATTLLWVIR